MVKDNVRKPSIGYLCSYFPHKLVSSLGFDTIFIGDQLGDFTGYKSELPVTICSYANYCRKVIGNMQYDGIVFTNCCNAAQRLYDVVRIKMPEVFCHMLELPRGCTDEEYKFFSGSVRQMLLRMCSFFKIPCPEDRLLDLYTSTQMDRVLQKDTVLVIGSAVHPAVRERINNGFGEYKLEYMLCNTRDSGDRLLQICSKSEVEELSALFEIKPCPRMSNFYSWFERLIALNFTAVAGVIHIAAQRCDNFLFAFPFIKEVCSRYSIPVLNIEEEYEATGAGQHILRFEAFIECLDSIRRAGEKHE